MERIPKTHNYINFYSGSEIEILRIKDLLEAEEIPLIVQNDCQSWNLGGFIGGTPSTIRLKIQESDFEKAVHLVENLKLK